MSIPKSSNQFGLPEKATLKIRAKMISLARFTREQSYHSANDILLAPLGSMFRYHPGLLKVYWDTDNKDTSDHIFNDIDMVLISKRAMGVGMGGLFVYPAGVTGEYYRVGMWKLCGVRKNFEIGDSRWESRTITLV